MLRLLTYALLFGTLASCAQSGPPPTTGRRETCNGNDDDLDGRTDEGNECVAGVIEGCEGGGSRTCTSACEWTSCGGVCDPGDMVPCGNCGVLVCGADRAWGECQSQGECSPGTEQSCESGSQICNAGCRWDACVNPECAPGEMRPCGACGTSTCTESGWGACEDELDCVPGMMQACALGGMETCTDSCTWGDCEGQGMCFPGTTRDCERCGSQTCGEDYTWGECSDQGECQAGETEGCGLGGIRTCNTECNWTDCTGEGECADGETRECGTHCGEQTCEDNAWSECVTVGNCIPGSDSDCGLGGTQSCDSMCQWGECMGEGECAPGTTGECGNCGSRTCNGDYTWGACEGEGECAPGATEGCGLGGTRTCEAACMWGEACEGEGDCSPGATQPCGNCGTQTCGADFAWGDCTGSGPCAPGEVGMCGVDGERTCTAACEFGPCSAQDGALDFDDHTVRIPESSDFTLSGGFTIEAWIRADATQHDHSPTIISGNYDSGGRQGWRFFITLWDSYLGSICFGNGNVIYPVTGTDIRDGEWHHVAVVRSGSTFIYYIDGIEDGRRSGTSATLNARDLHIGSSRGYRTNGFSMAGTIHSVRIWNDTRTASEILNNMEPEGPSETDGLVALWRFNEGSGQTVEDEAGGHDGTLGMDDTAESLDPVWTTYP